MRLDLPPRLRQCIDAAAELEHLAGFDPPRELQADPGCRPDPGQQEGRGEDRFPANQSKETWPFHIIKLSLVMSYRNRVCDVTVLT